MYAHSVQIGPEFFRKTFDDYSDRYWAFAREIMQNSIDCGSRNIIVQIRQDLGAGITRVVVTNDGEPMIDKILVEKLLSLGSSGKDFAEGKVGGFGKAKEMLYFAHEAYTIRSGAWIVAGSGAGYDLIPSPESVKGTISDVLWKGFRQDDLVAAFDTFIRLCSPGMKVMFWLNGVQIRGEVRIGDVERTLNDEHGTPWADVRLSNSRKAKYLVRIGGIPMIWGHCDYRGLVVLDLHGTSASKMTSNRDALKYPFGNQFSDFITKITIDKHTAFKLEKATYKRFRGNKLTGQMIDPKATAEQSVPEAVRIAAYAEAQPSKGAPASSSRTWAARRPWPRCSGTSSSSRIASAASCPGSSTRIRWRSPITPTGS